MLEFLIKKKRLVMVINCFVEEVRNDKEYWIYRVKVIIEYFI